MSKDENKRIDLKQFEGMSEGPWAYTHDPEEGLIIMGGNTMVAELSFLFTNMSPETDETNPSGLDPDAVDARVILASPDLIAALKKAYEKIDKQGEKIADYVERVETFHKMLQEEYEMKHIIPLCPENKDDPTEHDWDMGHSAFNCKVCGFEWGKTLRPPKWED
jgi:hypothetical protein